MVHIPSDLEKGITRLHHYFPPYGVSHYRQGKDEREGKAGKEAKPNKKKSPTEESTAQTDEMLAALNFADLGPVPPWTSEDADPENGGLTEFHIQVRFEGVRLLEEGRA